MWPVVILKEDRKVKFPPPSLPTITNQPGQRTRRGEGGIVMYSPPPNWWWIKGKTRDRYNAIKSQSSPKSKDWCYSREIPLQICIGTGGGGRRGGGEAPNLNSWRVFFSFLCVCVSWGKSNKTYPRYRSILVQFFKCFTTRIHINLITFVWVYLLKETI